MSHHDQPPRYQAYLLRLWEEYPHSDWAAEWRFSLEDPHTGERRGFADLDRLIAFLRKNTQQDLNSTIHWEDTSC
ncbi:MAG TPA: hypothetical protein VII92_09480 [Anaerolineae bacterium]